MVSKKISTGLCFQNGLNPILAYGFQDVLPVCAWFRAALMDPQTVDLEHGRPLVDPLEKHAFRLLHSLEFRVRPKAQPFPERFGDDNPTHFIDLEPHAIYNTIYHC